MRTATFRLTAMLMAALLGGCGLFGAREEPQATTRQALELPPDLARPQSNDPAARAPGGSVSYSEIAGRAPAGEAVQPSRPEPALPAAPAGVRLERDGAVRWLVIQDTPTAVMNRIRAFLQARRLPLEVDNPKAGLFETEWVERRINIGTNAFTRLFSVNKSAGFRDKYRFRIEAGRTAGTTEVYVSQLGLQERALRDDTGGAETGLQLRPTDLQAEAQMLADLMVAFGAGKEEAKTQVAATPTTRATRETDGLLLAQENFDRAWRRVGQALDRSAYIVEDRDRSVGTFYVQDREAAKGKKGSWLGGWLTIGEGSEVQEDRFQVVLKENAGGTRVQVLNVKGERVSTKSGERLIDYLFSQLQ